MSLRVEMQQRDILKNFLRRAKSVKKTTAIDLFLHHLRGLHAK
jgi:hypothetical protein